MKGLSGEDCRFRRGRVIGGGGCHARVFPFGRIGTITDGARQSGSGSPVDAAGNLHVPSDYQVAYEYLGSWAVADDSSHPNGSKQLHEVYASPGTIAAFRKTGQFPDGTTLVKEVFATATAPMTTGTVSRADQLQGLVCHGEGQKKRPSGQQALGRWLGLVMVRRRQAAQNNLNGLQERLPAVSRSRAIHGLDL